MKRSLNYTGRERIERKRISLSVIRENGAIASFVLSKLALDGLDLQEDARVYIEAYYRTELKRFDCGTSGNLRIPFAGDVRELAYPQNLKFRILVVNTADGKILAHADRFSPEAPPENKPILPVDFNLDKGVWRVVYDGEEGSPTLSINCRIPEHVARSDPQFFIYVYPAALREILTHMVFVDGVESVDEPAADWHVDWLKFCSYLGVTPPNSLNPRSDNFRRDDAIEWIDDTVEAFWNRYAGMFQQYISKLGEVQ